MVEVELDLTEAWGEDQNWQALSEQAVAEAFRFSSYGNLASAAFTLSLSINLSTNDEVHALNAQWRGKDKPTNVLSFPMLERDELTALANTDDGEALLGDLILAHGVCAAEAEEKGIPLADHVTHLIIHGTLHLLGYDHSTEEEKAVMWAEQAKVLERLGLSRIKIQE